MVKIISLCIGVILIVAYIFLFVGYYKAEKIKSLRKFYCKIGWHCHSKDYIYNSFDGASFHCTCKWCGYKGMLDSQGNLF